MGQYTDDIHPEEAPHFILLVKISSKNLRKNDAKQLQDLMKLVTGEMGSALNMMEKAKEEGAEDMKPLE